MILIRNASATFKLPPADVVKQKNEMISYNQRVKIQGLVFRKCFSYTISDLQQNKRPIGTLLTIKIRENTE